MAEERKRVISDIQLRHLQCWHCNHCRDKEAMSGGDSFSKSLCGIDGKWGSMTRAFFCQDFENESLQSETREYHGYRIKNRQVEDWRTRRQWEDAGFYVKPGEQPTMMFKNFLSAEKNLQSGLIGYYLPDQVVQKS